MNLENELEDNKRIKLDDFQDKINKYSIQD